MRLKKIEVAIRSVLANIGCQEFGDKYWITKADYFANAEKFNQTLAVIEKELTSSKEDSGMDDYRSLVFRQLELYLFQYCQQQADERHR